LRSDIERVIGIESASTAKPRYKSPGRKAMAKLCAGKPAARKRYAMVGNVPRVIEEDRQFFLRFQTSKKLEAVLFALRAEAVPDLEAIKAAQDAFNAAMAAVRARWFELIPETGQL
jgi:hypothetical protein